MKHLIRLTVLLGLTGLWACAGGDDAGDARSAGNDSGNESAAATEDLDPWKLPLAELIERADNRFTQGDLNGTRDFLLRELGLHPNSFEAYYRLGILELIQDSLKVHEYLDRAHELQPDHPGPFFFKGMVYRLADRPDLGREWLLKSYDLYWQRKEFNKDSLPQPTHAFVDSFVARALGPAFHGMREAAMADSSDAALWYWYARTALDFKKPSHATRAVARARLLAPESPAVIALEGVVQYRSKNRYGAVELAQEALTINPRHALGRHIYGHVLIDSGEYREGLIALWRAMLEEPNESSYIDYVGNYLHSYASAPLGFKFIQLALQTRGFLAEEHDWSGYMLN